METKVVDHISYSLNANIQRILSISGGDISQTYLIETATSRIFCKLNQAMDALDMFLTEKEGLKAITKTRTIKTPEVFFTESLDKGAFLLMEYIEPKRPSSKDMQQLGLQLAQLHKKNASSFGWEGSNFIGSLPQSNKYHKDWPSFYTNERLLPQLQMALDRGLIIQKEIPSKEKIIKRLKNVCPDVKPSLLHGDLWSGNYIISSDGLPYLIDPAVYFGHNEIDIAMTRLFGGFDIGFYKAYEEIYPKTPGADERQELYQLYYLLVHLNLFGRSYYGAVSRILKRYF